MRTRFIIKKILLLASLMLGYCIFAFAQPNIKLIATPWQLSADGQWIATIHVKNNTHSVVFNVSPGKTVPLAHWVYNASAVKIILNTPSSVHVIAKMKHGPKLTRVEILQSPLAYFHGLKLTTQAIGPYLINLGWAELNAPSAIRQYQLQRRLHDQGNYQTIATLSDHIRTFNDNKVLPQHHYQYRLMAIMQNRRKNVAYGHATTPSVMPHVPLDAMRGKGLIVVFDSDPESYTFYQKLSPQQIIETAHAIGIRYIELRTTYAGYCEFCTPALTAWVNQMLDWAHRYNIAMISWSIPRAATSDSIAADIRIASYKSPAGNGFAGIALDLEAGQGYFRATTAKQQIAQYGELSRMALGPHYLLSSIVFSPWDTDGSQDMPYKELAAISSVMQPMEFWHAYPRSHHHFYSDTEVTNAMKNSTLMTQQAAQRAIPINIIGQMVDLYNTGVPSAHEITEALAAAKHNGAIGVTFFDWNRNFILTTGQLTPQAQAIQQFVW